MCQDALREPRYDELVGRWWLPRSIPKKMCGYLLHGVCRGGPNGGWPSSLGKRRITEHHPKSFPIPVHDLEDIG